MKLTKQQEKELLLAYNTYWESYIKGDVKTIVSLLDDDYNQIGSAESEVFFNKKDAVKFLYETIDQVAGKAEMRNRIIKVEPLEEFILINDLFDIYVLIETEWSFYSKFRASTLMQKKEEGWKFIHQHSSMPDTRTQDGENIAIEKITVENLQLREAVKRRTAELEHKNRELEIEASLERIRAIAMGMMKSDDLMDVCKVLLTELNTLGFENIRNTQIDILNDEKKSFLNYEYSDYGVNGITEVIYDSHPIVTQFVNDVRSAPDALSFKEVTGSELDEWREHRKKNNHLPDAELEKATSLFYYCYSIGTGALGVSSFSPISDERLEILKRFRNVFELAYRRYNDITLAEAQAREAQIEASLERVRAVAMSMNKPDDLLSICEISFKEFQKLGFDNLRNTIIHVLNDEKGFFLDYDFSNKMDGSITKIYYNSHPVVENYLKQIKRAEDAFAEVVIERNQLNDWKEFRRKSGQRDDPRLENIPALYYYFHSIGVGDIGISTFKPIDESQIKILKRFRNVFDLAYRTYTDITKAEAQARESQIQLALERVRARTMAMHKSEELSETSFVLFEQLKELGEVAEQISIIIYNEKEGIIELYATIYGNQWEEMGKIPFEKHFVHRNIYNAWKEKNKSFVIDLSGEELNDFNKFKMEYSAQYKSEDDLPQDRWVIHNAFFSKGALVFSTHEPRPLETIQLLERFAGVFEQTYTRFLDLQKAEAQAKEAQIEAALERVRSRTMGMQKSEELKEVIQLIYEQFVHLNIFIEHTGFIMDYKARDDMNIWLADQHGAPSQVTTPYFDSVYWNRFNEAKEKGMDFFATNLTFEEKNRHYQKLFKYIPGLPKEAKEFYFSCPGLAISTVLLENVCLYIENFSGIPYSDEENNTLMRFGNVFQQTYTRFLDLQKAEDQAKEAKIETALERVRSRTMAMYDSNELLEAVAVFFQQFKSLGLLPSEARTYFCHINTDTHTAKVWMTHTDGKVMNGSHLTPLDKSPSMLDFYDAWKRKEPLNIRNYSGKALADYMQFLLTLPHVAKDKGYQHLLNVPPERIVMTDANFLHGNIGVMTFEPLSQEALDTLVRFAKVFELTYTRFLDLQKAEAQAREAQIEAALERVRSKAMAMHSSEDLALTVDTFFTELTNLKVTPRRCGVTLIDEKSHIADLTVTTATEHDKEIKMIGKLKLSGHPVLDNVYNNWKLQKEYHTVLRGDEIKNYYQVMNPQIEYPNFSDDETQYGYYFYFKEGGVFAWTEKELTERELEIFRRYTSVLSLTYRRYIDLKEAEAQAREAQIEAALEKVRARAMAMQKPNELIEVAELLRKEMGLLGVEELETSSIYIHNEVAGTTQCWYAIQDIREQDKKLITDHMTINLNDTWVGREMLKFYNSSEEQTSIIMQGENRKEWINYCARQSKVFQGYYGDVIPERTYHLLKFSNGYMGAASPSDISIESWALLKRATTVFALAYTRFSDLQLSEAQARESQIELALERVRARTMAMQRSNELAETAAILFKQLINLGIEPNRLYIAIIKDDNGNVEFWITDEDGSKVSTGFEANLDENRSFQKMYKGWKKQIKSITIDMQGKELEEYFLHLSKLRVPFRGGLSQKRRVQSIAYFSKGFIGIASPDAQSEETTDLLERFAAVFNLTYTRFNDLQQAEAQNKIIQADNERKTQELEEARQLQLSMLPKELPDLPNLDIAVYMQTATEVGGDYYDFQVGIDGTLTTIIGDATGHGMKAGTVVTITKSLFNSMAANENILGTFDKISQVIKGMKFRQLAMCLIMMKIRGNRLSMSSAAMPPALIYRAKNKSVEEILLKGMPLGTMKKFPYKKIEGRLNSGDRILLYSDGLPELASDNNEMYGYDRIKTEFQSVGEKESEEIVNHLKNSASKWANGREPDDDVTFVVIKVK